MKSLDSQIRQKGFRLNECQRRAAQLEGMIAELKRRSGELDHDINLEHNRTKISDSHHFAYSPLAKSLTKSRANLERSIQTFEAQLEAEKRAASAAVETLNELLQERNAWTNTSRSTDPSTERSVGSAQWCLV
jgi:molecular chaperone GrpE (heat shock protein)